MLKEIFILLIVTLAHFAFFMKIYDRCNGDEYCIAMRIKNNQPFDCNFERNGTFSCKLDEDIRNEYKLEDKIYTFTEYRYFSAKYNYFGYDGRRKCARNDNDCFVRLNKFTFTYKNVTETIIDRDNLQNEIYMIKANFATQIIIITTIIVFFYHFYLNECIKEENEKMIKEQMKREEEERERKNKQLKIN